MIRRPRQRRAQQTVEAVLDAVERVVVRYGATAVTTNRIAQAAGVSIGSLYQYFPDKQAIFAALHDRHVEQMSRLVEKTLVAHAGEPAQSVLRALADALIAAHATDPVAGAQLLIGAPGPSDFAVRLRGVLRLALGRHVSDPKLFVLSSVLDALTHAAALQRPKGMSLKSARAASLRAVRACLRA